MTGAAPGHTLSDVEAMRKDGRTSLSGVEVTKARRRAPVHRSGGGLPDPGGGWLDLTDPGWIQWR
jgi:hypothetical protein